MILGWQGSQNIFVLEKGPSRLLSESSTQRGKLVFNNFCIIFFSSKNDKTQRSIAERELEQGDVSPLFNTFISSYFSESIVFVYFSYIIPSTHMSYIWL